ncbi:hypothetical protein ABKZ05_000446 [Vibrio navarrensis]|uniref:Uncharacterized protein n=1 Tax=Vibrio navarrensis TaxID=29495 RepID=A0AAI9CS32_9VIBR|nr:hypothetical protein [Vibrio navarrensis]EJL6398678.1 hypothetical protein [Vibrio navarrensis]EJL6566030.1 hypothetical protein [Vibrio navarrensis]EKA5635085.1 hypothetical protein [Vibrio navarrensis]ELN6931186.1 hypothetical protein [Vibrio navarrensis]MBE4618129.1 hypothetical protein [Vibrio navarrensis]
MNNKLTLSIAMTSVITLNSGMAFADATTEAPVEAQSSSQHGGKCAAGKCGTEKRFEKQELKNDPQGRLVRARDGKCGVTGEGINPSEETIKLIKSKVTGGVCGQ